MIDGNLSLQSKEFDSPRVEANHQPEASLACECGNALLERSQRMPKRVLASRNAYRGCRWYAPSLSSLMG